MRSETHILNVVQDATGVGTAFGSAEFIDKMVQVAGIAGGATLVVEGTVNGSNWITEATIAADGVTVIDKPWVQLRINRTVQGTGNPTVRFVGRNSRSE